MEIANARRISLRELGPITDGDWILSSDYSESGVRLLQVGDVGRNTFIGRSKRHISKDRANELRCTFLRPGDILISRMPDPIGRACAMPEIGTDCITAVDVSIWRPNPQIAETRFLCHYLNSDEWLASVRQLAAGATRARISRLKLQDLRVPLPSLPEQRRIADRLDEQMAAVAAARAAAEGRIAHLLRLRQTALDSVFPLDGQITNRVRLGHVLALRNEVIHPYDNPTGNSIFVGLEHVESHTGVRSGFVAVDLSQLKGRKPQFYCGDIVYGYLRPYLNKVWVAEFEGLCSVDQYVYKVNNELANTSYVAWYMRSPTFLARAPVGTTPGQLPRIRTEEVARTEIPLPNLAIQRVCVERIERMMRASQAADCAGRTQLEAINALPAALLREAFGGGS